MSAQAMEALAKANEIRIGGAAIRRELKALERVDSLTRAAEYLRDPDDVVRRMRVGHFLCGIRLVRASTMRRLLRSAALPTSAEDSVIGPVEWDSHRRPLTERQRLSLAVVLESIAEGLR